MKPQTVYSKVKKHLEGCALLTATFDKLQKMHNHYRAVFFGRCMFDAVP
jgi:hypothetical protein